MTDSCVYNSILRMRNIIRTSLFLHERLSTIKRSNDSIASVVELIFHSHCEIYNGALKFAGYIIITVRLEPCHIRWTTPTQALRMRITLLAWYSQFGNEAQYHRFRIQLL